jgi:hypothetical protein
VLSLERTIERWGELMYALMYQHHGFPVQYMPLVHLLRTLGQTRPLETRLAGSDFASPAASTGARITRVSPSTTTS